MRKFIGVFAVLAGVLMVPGISSAAVNITHLTFPDSGTNATLEAGGTVDTKVTFNLTGTSELEAMSLQIVDNLGNDIGMPEVCINVSDRIVAGTFTRVGPFDTVGGTEGTFGVRVRGYGVTGAGTDNNCGGTVQDNVFFSNRLTLTEEQNEGEVANNTGNGGSSGTGNVGGYGQVLSSINSLTALIEAYIKAQTATPPAPTKPAYCASMVQYSGYNAVAAQAWLIANPPHNAGFLAAGVYAPTGYWGPISQAAHAGALAACK